MASSKWIICDECGVTNPAGTEFCRDCGAKLPSVQTEIKAPPDMSRLFLKEKNTGKEIVIDSPDVTIGRDEPFEHEFFSSDRKVSSTHCRIFYENKRWVISEFKEEPSKNGTSIRRRANERKIQVRSTPIPLFDGAEVYIADLCFEVQIERKPERSSPDTDSTPATAETTPEKAQEYVIICPVCGSEFVVDGPDDKIQNCPDCTDMFDRRQIARIAPILRR